MQAESQGKSATLSSNTHSGWASSHYSPPGAKVHLPHILSTTQSPRHATSPFTQSRNELKIRKMSESEVRGRWTPGGFLPRYGPISVCSNRHVTSFNSHDLSGWLGMRKHVPHGRWHVCVFCQINTCKEKRPLMVSLLSWADNCSRNWDSLLLLHLTTPDVLQTWSCFLWSTYQSTQTPVNSLHIEWALSVYHVHKTDGPHPNPPSITNSLPVNHCFLGEKGVPRAKEGGRPIAINGYQLVTFRKLLRPLMMDFGLSYSVCAPCDSFPLAEAEKHCQKPRLW